MPKTKKIFTKHNSQKFVLFTEGRNEDGEKIQQNCLIPVSYNRIPGNTLLIQKLAGACGPATKLDKKDQETKVENPHTSKKKQSRDPIAEGVDLEDILNQFHDSNDDWISDVDSDDEKNENSKLSIFQGSCSSASMPPNVHIEILEDDVSSDEFGEIGQFSDADSSDEEQDEFMSNLLKRSTLTSSKDDCPENIKLLNEGFEKVLAEYRDDQIGALDDEEICGTFSTENEQMQNFIYTPLKREELTEIGQCDETLKNRILQLSEVDGPDKIIEIVTEKPLEWDCESILSTYSNKYNHPFVIKEESKIKKIKIPNNPLQKMLTKSRLRQLDTVSEGSESGSDDDEKCSVATSCNTRPKGETPEQKRERKSLFREAKRESRKLKKENKLAFKNEMLLQKAQAMSIQKNRGIRLL